MQLVSLISSGEPGPEQLTNAQVARASERGSAFGSVLAGAQQGLRIALGERPDGSSARQGGQTLRGMRIELGAGRPTGKRGVTTGADGAAVLPFVKGSTGVSKTNAGGVLALPEAVVAKVHRGERLRVVVGEVQPSAKGGRQAGGSSDVMGKGVLARGADAPGTEHGANGLGRQSLRDVVRANDALAINRSERGVLTLSSAVIERAVRAATESGARSAQSSAKGGDRSGEGRTIVTAGVESPENSGLEFQVVRGQRQSRAGGGRQPSTDSAQGPRPSGSAKRAAADVQSKRSQGTSKTNGTSGETGQPARTSSSSRGVLGFNSSQVASASGTVKSPEVSGSQSSAASPQGKSSHTGASGPGARGERTGGRIIAQNTGDSTSRRPTQSKSRGGGTGKGEGHRTRLSFADGKQKGTRRAGGTGREGKANTVRRRSTVQVTMPSADSNKSGSSSRQRLLLKTNGASQAGTSTGGKRTGGRILAQNTGDNTSRRPTQSKSRGGGTGKGEGHRTRLSFADGKQKGTGRAGGTGREGKVHTVRRRSTAQVTMPSADSNKSGSSSRQRLSLKTNGASQAGTSTGGKRTGGRIIAQYTGDPTGRRPTQSKSRGGGTGKGEGHRTRLSFADGKQKGRRRAGGTGREGKANTVRRRSTVQVTMPSTDSNESGSSSRQRLSLKTNGTSQAGPSTGGERTEQVRSSTLRGRRLEARTFERQNGKASERQRSQQQSRADASLQPKMGGGERSSKGSRGIGSLGADGHRNAREGMSFSKDGRQKAGPQTGRVVRSRGEGGGQRQGGHSAGQQQGQNPDGSGAGRRHGARQAQKNGASSSFSTSGQGGGLESTSSSSAADQHLGGRTVINGDHSGWTSTLSELGSGGSSPKGGGRAGSSPPRSLPSAWLRSVSQAPLRTATSASGWKALKMALAEGDGTVTVKARQDSEGMSVSVGFSDARLRAQVSANARHLQDAMQAQYGTDVDLSFTGGDTGSRDGALAEQSGRDGGVPAAAVGESSSEDDGEGGTIRRNGRREWIG